MFKKRFSNQVPSKSLGLVMIRCLTLRLKKEGVLVNKPWSQLVKGVVRSIMVISLKKRIIVFVLEKVDIKFEISLISRGKTSTVDKQVVEMLMLQRRTFFMLSALKVSKRLFPTWWPVCWKYFLSTYIIYLITVLPCHFLLLETIKSLTFFPIS